MNNIRPAGYSNLKEFIQDYEVFRLNPNDQVMMNSVALKINNSPNQVREQIGEEMISILMETNPQGFISRISKMIPKSHRLTIKTRTDPFFEV